MGIKSLVAAAALAVGVGQAADAAVLRFTFDATVIESALYCEEGPGSCNLDQSRDYDYSEGDTGQAFARVWDGKVRLTFLGSSLYEHKVERYGNSYSSTRLEYPSFESWHLSWDEDSGIFEFANDGYPAWESFKLALSNPTMSPIPLPASAALLPMGVGALALMRRRRKARPA